MTPQPQQYLDPCMAQLVEALKENHDWHLAYSNQESPYQGSYLYNKNVEALTAAQQPLTEFMGMTREEWDLIGHHLNEEGLYSKGKTLIQISNLLADKTEGS